MKCIIAGLVVAANLAAPVAAEEHRVTIRGMAFQPSVLKVAVGDTVVFANTRRAAHTATATDGAFDTGRIGSGKVAGIEITNAGTIHYICDYHPSVQGRIVAN